MTVDPDTRLLGRTPGLPEEHFVHDGLITKRLVRSMALAQLRPNPATKSRGEMLWDLGTGAGSIAVEWCRSGPEMRAVGVERKADRAANARANAANLTLPGQFEVIESAICDALDELPDPDAVFIGGGATREIVNCCLARLTSGGRIVVHGVTIDTEILIAQLHGELGGELVRVHVETAEPIGKLRGFAAARAISGWTYWL